LPGGTAVSSRVISALVVCCGSGPVAGWSRAISGPCGSGGRSCRAAARGHGQATDRSERRRPICSTGRSTGRSAWRRGDDLVRVDVGRECGRRRARRLGWRRRLLGGADQAGVVAAL